MSEVKIIQTTPSEITTIVEVAVEKTLNKFKQELSSFQKEDKLLTREETCSLLSINLSTLWSWDKQGKLSSKKIGNRVYYLKSEILESLK